MFANYHTHTARCHHATGTDEEYVKYAIAEGVKVLGFSDHAPMFYGGGYESYYKMLPEELPGYIASISRLGRLYADKIELHIGLETEYYPRLWTSSLDFWGRHGIEYLILGQHFVGEETDVPADPASRPSDDKLRLTKYVNTVIRAIDTGKITYVAHPDLLNYTGRDINFYYDEMGRLIDAMASRGMPVEFNLLGMVCRRSYPRREFFEEVARRGASVILGCDAHEPERVADKSELKEAYRTLSALGLNIIEKIKLVNPWK